MKLKKEYKKVIIGVNEHNECIYLTPPKWSCGWYWSFGWLGNRNTHYHLDSLGEKINRYSHDEFIKHFKKKLNIRTSDLYSFSEIVSTIYEFKNFAEILNRGGSHYTKNPCSDIIKNPEELERINKTILPELFDKLYELLYRNENNDELFKDLVKIDDEGLTSKTIKFMKENLISIEDLKLFDDNVNYNHTYINGLTSHDFNRIHSAYWKDYHSNKKQ